MALFSHNGVEVHDVSSISPRNTKCSITVKVIRLWNSYTLQVPNAVNSVQMVLMDSKGDKIHASVHQTLLFKFQNLLAEDVVYKISTFDVVQNTGPFKTTKHDFKIRFNLWTQISLLTDIHITGSPFSFVPYSQILSKEWDAEYFLDIIGSLSAVGKVLEWVNDGVTKKRIQIELEADSQRMECVLLGTYVDELTNFLAKGHDAYSIVVIQLAKMRILNGVQTIVGPTKLLFNPDIDEVNMIAPRFLGDSDGPIKVIRQLPDPCKAFLRQDILFASSVKTIKEIRTMDENSTCVTFGEIKAFQSHRDWWFPLVKYKRGRSPNGRVKSMIPKYHIPVLVADKTGIATFVICDDEAAQLFGKSCADLLGIHREGVRSSSMPDEVCSLIGRVFLFKILVNNASTKKFEPLYTVRKLCWDTEIIDEFKLMYPNMGDLRDSLDNLKETTTKSDYDVGGSSTGKVVLDAVVDITPKTQLSGNQIEVKTDGHNP